MVEKLLSNYYLLLYSLYIHYNNILRRMKCAFQLNYKIKWMNIFMFIFFFQNFQSKYIWKDVTS